MGEVKLDQTNQYQTGDEPLVTLPKVLHPGNFNEHYKRYQSGDESLSSLFDFQTGRFYCEAPTLPSQPERIFLVDADDTLWEDNLYYEEIIAELTRHLIDQGSSLSPQEIRKEIDDIEHEIIAEHGFGALGFERSMNVAFERLGTRDMQRPAELLDSIIPTLSAIPREVPESSIELLRGLKERGGVVVLFTQGPLEIQLGKVARSNLASELDAIAISPTKKTADYELVLEQCSSTARRISVIGNSLKSEVIPALSLGFEAFHFENPNTWHAGNAAEIDPASFHSVQDLREILKLI